MKFSFLRNVQINKTWVVLGVAIVVGALAAVGARSYLAQQMGEIEARSKGKTINLVVAKQALKRGDKLSADNVAVRPIPVDYAHSAAVTPKDFERIDGQALGSDVGPGEMILWSLLAAKRAPTFSSYVETGRRAMTVPVDEISSISGMLEPGDVIDLMVSVDREGRKTTFPLLQTVKVMATGQRSIDDPKTGTARQFATVTLDTTPEEAQRVIVAREAGRITALLRNPQDNKTMAGTRSDIDALLGLTVKPPAGKAGQVPVLYGGQGNGHFSDDAVTLAKRVAKLVQDAKAGAGATAAVPSAPASSPAQDPVSAAVQAALRP